MRRRGVESETGRAAQAAAAGHGSAPQGQAMGGGAAAAAVPKAWVVHAALVVAQAAFGGGAIVGKFGVHGTNPVLFALIREGFAGPLLCLAALVLSRREALKHRQAQASSREALRPPPPLLPSVSDIPKVVLAGSCLFFNQLFFILGLKFMDPIICSVWQLSQPVMTTCIAVMLGFEQPSAQKLLGMFLAIGGAVFMVLAGAETTISRGISEALLGHALLFSNCLSTSLYVIVTKAGAPGPGEALPRRVYRGAELHLRQRADGRCGDQPRHHAVDVALRLLQQGG